MNAKKENPNPPQSQSAPPLQYKLELLTGPDSALHVPRAEPWPEPVDGALLLDSIRAYVPRFVVLPRWVPELIALWVLHTYAFELRDVAVYLGIDSPVKRCGKTTLLKVLSKLVNRPVVAANISSSAFFRVIGPLLPTILIDEADKSVNKNEELRSILNAGYQRDAGYVVRAINQPAGSEPQPSTTDVARFPTWCPKAMAAIGHLPDVLADRCIPIHMQRKSPKDKCERLRSFKGEDLRRQCARFVLDHAAQIAAAEPQLPAGLNDRAADIWEPLFVLADLAGGQWPALARQAAIELSQSAQENNPAGALFLDIFIVFSRVDADRLFSRTIVEELAHFSDRPWFTLRSPKDLTERWLADRLREYHIHPKTLRIGDEVGRGYLHEDLNQAFRSYISPADVQALRAQHTVIEPPAPTPPPTTPPPESPPTSST